MCMMRVYLYTCEIILSVTCVSLMRKTTLNLLIYITQQTRRHLQRSCRSSLCTFYSPSCLFLLFFYFLCQVLSFLCLSLSLFLSLWVLWRAAQYFWARVSYYKSCSAIRNCEFFLNKNKTFFCFVFDWLCVLLCFPLFQYLVFQVIMQIHRFITVNYCNFSLG